MSLATFPTYKINLVLMKINALYLYMSGLSPWSYFLCYEELTSNFTLINTLLFGVHCVHFYWNQEISNSSFTNETAKRTRDFPYFLMHSSFMLFFTCNSTVFCWVLSVATLAKHSLCVQPSTTGFSIQAYL